MSKTGRVNQQLVNGIKTMDSRSTLTSILFLLWDMEDTSTIYHQEILSLRLKMVERARNGTSINLPEPSDLERRINPLISSALVKETTCNTTLPHQDGGKCSSLLTMVTCPTTEMVRYSLLRIERMKKLNQSISKTDLAEETLPKSGRLSTPKILLMIRLEKPITNSDSELTPTS
jgi:hypothetical protein